MVTNALKAPIEEYMLKKQVAEEQQLQYVIDMVQLLRDNFLPPGTCDASGFANCLMDNGEGVKLDRYDWNIDRMLKSETCASFGCNIKYNTDPEASDQDEEKFSKTLDALSANLNDETQAAFNSLEQSLMQVQDNIIELNENLNDELVDAYVASDLGCSQSCLNDALDAETERSAERITENIVASQCCEALSIVSVTNIQGNEIIPTEQVNLIQCMYNQ